MSEASRAAIRRVLESMLTAGKVAKPRAPSAYIVFSNEKRKTLQDLDVAFKAMTSSEKMSHLGKLWKELAEPEKATYQAQSEAGAAKLASSKPVEAPMDGPLKFPLEVKSDAAMKKLTKQLAAEATAALIDELKSGTPVTLTGTGKLTPVVDDKGVVTITFKPSKTKKE